MCHTLIIEDEVLQGFLLADLAEEAGASSFAFAATEDEAVAGALARRPDFIICDVHLGRGDGPTAVGRIRREFGTIPTIFVTGTPEECERYPEAEAVVVKPVNGRQLVEAFRHHARMLAARRG